MSLTLKHPFTAVISGPTGCRKTQFTIRLLQHASKMIDPPPQRILWCYGAYQKAFTELKNVEFHEGVPDTQQFDGAHRTLLILDDLMQETDDRVTKIFTKLSHHADMSVLYLTQNLFYGGKQNRTITLNAHYLFLFKNPRDAAQVGYLARQIFSQRSKFLVEAYQDATEKPYTYLCIDLKPDTEEKLRIRGNISQTK